MERQREQSSANRPNVRQVWGRNQAGHEHRNTRGKQTSSNTGRQEVESDRRILIQNKTGNNWPKEQNHDTVFPVFYSCTRQGSHPGQYGETAATSNQLSFKPALTDLLPYNTDRSPFKADLVNVLADFCWLAHPADVCGQVSSSISPIFTLNMVSVTCWVNYPGSLAAKFTTIFTDLSLTFDLKLIRLLFLCCAGSVQCVYQSFFFFSWKQLPAGDKVGSKHQLKDPMSLPML